MANHESDSWKKKIVTPEKVFEKIAPGMKIFLGTGVAEPRTLVKHLVESGANNLQDLELIQLVSFGDAIKIGVTTKTKFRLKTFFAGWIASDAITDGTVDLIPCRFSTIPSLIDSGAIPIDVAFVQISPPDESGYSSLGVAVDGARMAMEHASLSVGEINEAVPYTLGDTIVNIDEFDFLIQSTEPLIYFPRWPFDDVFDKLASNVASIVEDGSCIAFSIGPLFEALSIHMAQKRNLGIHSPFFTDSLMDLVKSGAVTNRYKSSFRGKCVCCYALGTPELMRWLDHNPLVEFQGIDILADPKTFMLNDRFISILPARKVDLTGRIAFHLGKGNVVAGPGEAYVFFTGAMLSPGGRTIIALPSRNRKGEPNILLSVEEYPNQFTNRESLDMVVTEYGVAYLSGRTVRERAQSLIDIAHPDDRLELFSQAKEAKILYQDQIFLPESLHTYPNHINIVQTFANDLTIRFRPIKPSDEEDMRNLFYRFSDNSVYYRYFSPVKTMPHSKMQEYVNVDYVNTMSIVGIHTDGGTANVIAEARYVRLKNKPFADVAFVVDEKYQGKGIATFIFLLLIEIAKEKGIKGFTADVLASNKPMMRVFEKSPYPVEAHVESGIYELTIPFSSTAIPGKKHLTYTHDEIK